MIAIQTDLSPGEFICDTCHGRKLIDHNICPKCNGAGKVDWIENIIGKQAPLIWGQKTISSLSKVNVRRMINYIQQTLTEVIEYHSSCDLSPAISHDIYRDMDHILKELHSKKLFKDFIITNHFTADNTIDISAIIQPQFTAETVHIDFKIT